MTWVEAMAMANRWARKTGSRYMVRRELFHDTAALVADQWIWKVYLVSGRGWRR